MNQKFANLGIPYDSQSSENALGHKERDAYFKEVANMVVETDCGDVQLARNMCISYLALSRLHPPTQFFMMTFVFAQLQSNNVLEGLEDAQRSPEKMEMLAEKFSSITTWINQDPEFYKRNKERPGLRRHAEKNCPAAL